MKKKPQGHVNHERYLVTYSDLITLLLAFFIILYALSDPDPGKMDSLTQQFAIEFAPNAPNTFEVAIGSNRSTSERTSGETLTSEEKKMMEAVSENASLEELKKQVDAEIAEKELSDDVYTQITPEGLKIILTDSVLFSSASASINNAPASNLIIEIGHLVTKLHNPISIEGHTDNIPISTSSYASNWELSTARAISVLKTIVNGDKELDPTRFSATGYGEYKPLYSNVTMEGREKNRRVEILVIRVNGDGLLTVPNRKEVKS